ncbi:hypothetical protein MRB53_006567 [Persea americana]|uniref:Uncharacterized protein n=1 Tax=Persea americana TaxID=3435 RepID=A0ACC2MHK2_PERAE|nr:hypothetical protein MRB53_006567 [Persea americana]
MEFPSQPSVPAIYTACKESTVITVLDTFPQPVQMPNMCFSHPMPVMQSTQQLQQMPGMHSSERLQHPTSSASQGHCPRICTFASLI